MCQHFGNIFGKFVSGLIKNININQKCLARSLAPDSRDSFAEIQCTRELGYLTTHKTFQPIKRHHLARPSFVFYQNRVITLPSAMAGGSIFFATSAFFSNDCIQSDINHRKSSLNPNENEEWNSARCINNSVGWT